jgi:hypothetical protein
MSKRIKLPKRLAGVKIPKGVRKGPVIKFLNTPPGQVVLAQAVLLIGGAFAVGKDREGGELPTSLESLKAAGDGLRDRANNTGAKLTRAFAAAAHAFREVMEEDVDDDEPRRGERSDESRFEESVETGRKKSRVRSDAPSTPH